MLLYIYRALVLDSSTQNALMPYSTEVVEGIEKFIAAVTGNTSSKLVAEFFPVRIAWSLLY